MLPRHGPMDGLLRCRDGVLQRLVHVDGEGAVVRVAQTARDRVLLGAQATSRAVAQTALDRMRFALGLDDDLEPFHARFKGDPLIGRAMRAHPMLRVGRRPEPFEALAWAVCEQLIEFERAVAIERRIVRALGRRCPRTGLRDAPDAQALAAAAPALLCSFDLNGPRAIALVRAAREVARGRVDLHCADPAEQERGWRHLRAIPGIGTWTIDCLALHGQGRLDVLPAGDLGLRKLVGRLLSGGDPAARVSEEEVREFFAPYEGWAGLAGAYALRAGGPRALRQAGTRSSASAPPVAA